jgi:hypothetical protein
MFRRFAVALLAYTIAGTGAYAQAPPSSTVSLTAEAIMARVAANQDRAEAERAHFVYVQHARVQSRKGSTIMCEEITDFRVTPSPKGQERALLSLSGHVRNGKDLVHYTEFPVNSSKPKAEAKSDGTEDKDDGPVNIGDSELVNDVDHGGKTVTVKDTDIDLVENMRKHFTADSKSKDGMNAGLFPLTSQQQKEMIFELRGREAKNGRDTYHIVFHPKDKEDFGWKGDAWIDATEFQPVVVRTALSRSMPFAVKALLGTNVPGLGFTVTYAPQQGNIWFPAGFGTEFKLKVLFFFSREIVISVENRNFERTHVTSTVHGADVALDPPAAGSPDDSAKPQP